MAQKATLESRILLLEKIMVHPQRDLLQDIASPDLVYVHSSGTVRDYQGFVKEFMEGQTKVTSAKFSDQSIQLIDKDLAIVRHRLVADSIKEGYPPIIDIIILEVWRLEKRKWKLLARQAAKKA